MKKRESQEVEYVDGKEVLNDVSPKTGKRRDWKGKKMRNGLVKQAYLKTAEKNSVKAKYYEKKAERLHECASFLVFNEYVSEDGEPFLKAKHINSCRVKLCPICLWRRSMKIHSQMRNILEALDKENKYAYIFLTLTVPNVLGDKLSEKITEMMEAWRKLIGYDEFEAAVKGWCRVLEITHNVNKASSSYNTYHPHFHCVLVVNKSYFTDKIYLKQERWKSMWRLAMRDESITQVDVRRVKANGERTGIVAAVCEAGKYTVKDTDYIMPYDWDLTCETIEVLDSSLHKRKLIAYGGVMKQKHKELNLDDPVDGDLLDTGENDDGELLRERTFFWHLGYQQYLAVE